MDGKRAKKQGIFLPYCAGWCARLAFKPSAISTLPCRMNTIAFSPLKKNIQCRVYWEPSQGSCVVGFHTFLLGMYGWERTVSCMVRSDCPTVRTTGSSFWQMLLGKCFFFFSLKLEASFFPHCCCRHSVAFVGNLFSFMAVSKCALLPCWCGMFVKS